MKSIFGLATLVTLALGSAPSFANTFTGHYKFVSCTGYMPFLNPTVITLKELVGKDWKIKVFANEDSFHMTNSLAMDIFGDLEISNFNDLTLSGAHSYNTIFRLPPGIHDTTDVPGVDFGEPLSSQEPLMHRRSVGSYSSDGSVYVFTYEHEDAGTQGQLQKVRQKFTLTQTKNGLIVDMIHETQGLESRSDGRFSNNPIAPGVMNGRCELKRL